MTDPIKPLITLVCFPVRAMPEPGIPGSVLASCSRCDEQVWLSPSSFPVVLSGKAVPYCPVCAKGEIDAAAARGEPQQWGGMLPNQTEELRAALKEEEES